MNGLQPEALQREAFKYSPVALLPTEQSSPSLTNHVVKSGDRAELVTTIDSPAFRNECLEIEVANNASLNHWLVIDAPQDAVHLQQIIVNLGADAHYTLNAVTFASKWSRCDIQIRLNGSGAECHLRGLDLGNGHTHADRHILIEHVVGKTKSSQLFKGVFDDHATASFFGKIKVHHGADGSSALQTNRNLLLSAHANVNTRPQLEIDTDDVQCTHGATVGQLDDNAVFFLRSRGLSEKAARAMLTEAFAGEVLRSFGSSENSSGLELKVRRWLSEGMDASLRRHDKDGGR
jgi:Fe-S cluster assembly protein SufD